MTKSIKDKVYESLCIGLDNSKIDFAISVFDKMYENYRECLPIARGLVQYHDLSDFSNIDLGLLIIDSYSNLSKNPDDIIQSYLDENPNEPFKNDKEAILLAGILKAISYSITRNKNYYWEPNKNF